MEVYRESISFNLFDFIAVHTVTKNHHSNPKDVGFIALVSVSSNSQSYLKEMILFLSRGE